MNRNSIERKSECVTTSHEQIGQPVLDLTRVSKSRLESFDSFFPEEVTSYTLNWGLLDRDRYDDEGRYDEESRKENRLEVPFPTAAVISFRNMKKLSIINCPHRTIPSEIGHLKELTELHLGFCDFTELPPSITELEKLEKITIHFCRELRSLPTDIGCLQNLKELNITLSSINLIPPSLCSLKKMEIVKFRYMNNRRGLTLPSELFSIKSLKNLDVSHCSVDFPDNDSSPHNLEKLEMDYVESNLPDNLSQLFPDLKTFGLKSVLPRLQPSLFDLKNLTELRINGCHFPSIPSAITNLSSLRKLCLCVSGECANTLPLLPGLKELTLNIRGVNDSTQRDRFVLNVFDGGMWKEGTCLEYLFIDMRDGSTFDGIGDYHGYILQGLPRTLKTLHLDGVKIHHLGDILMNEILPAGITNFYLDHRDIGTSYSADERRRWTRHLLTQYDRLRFVSLGDGIFPLPFFELYLMKLNQCGRAFLLKGSSNSDGGDIKPLPMSIWPPVLARVHGLAYESWTTDMGNEIGHETRRKELEASILFQLLQGPAFLSRALSKEEDADNAILSRMSTDNPTATRKRKAIS